MWGPEPLLCLGSTSYTQTRSTPSSPADGETPFTIHSICTHFLPWCSAYNECLKTNTPASQVRNASTFSDDTFSASAVVKARTPGIVLTVLLAGKTG